MSEVPSRSPSSEADILVDLEEKTMRAEAPAADAPTHDPIQRVIDLLRGRGQIIPNILPGSHPLTLPKPFQIHGAASAPSPKKDPAPVPTPTPRPSSPPPATTPPATEKKPEDKDAGKRPRSDPRTVHRKRQERKRRKGGLL